MVFSEEFSCHPLIVDDSFCERLVFSTPDLLAQIHPLAGLGSFLACESYGIGVNGYEVAKR